MFEMFCSGQNLFDRETLFMAAFVADPLHALQLLSNLRPPCTKQINALVKAEPVDPLARGPPLPVDPLSRQKVLDARAQPIRR